MGSQTTQPDRRVVLGVTWADGTPRVRLCDDGAAESRLEPLRGLRLNYRASPGSPRRCLGHTPFRRRGVDHVDCTNPPEPGSRQCTRCSIVEATFASNLHHAHTRDRADIDPAVAEHLQQPNLLYVAAFRDGSVKVGTSTEQRCHKRLVEQGAWRAEVAARAADGYAVRDLEDRVTAELGLPQSVSAARKVEGMATPRAEAWLAAEVARRAEDVGALVARMADPRLRPSRREWRFPGSDDDLWSGLHRYPLRLDSGSHDLEVVDACGRLVLLRRPGAADLFVADLGQLFGVELDIGDYESDELAVQDSLF